MALFVEVFVTEIDGGVEEDDKGLLEVFVEDKEVDGAEIDVDVNNKFFKMGEFLESIAPTFGNSFPWAVSGGGLTRLDFRLLLALILEIGTTDIFSFTTGALLASDGRTTRLLLEIGALKLSSLFVDASSTPPSFI